MKKLTHEQFIKNYNEKWSDSNLEIIGQYNGAHEKIMVRCKIRHKGCKENCNGCFEVSPSNLMHGIQQCDYANKHKKRKTYEEFIEDMKMIHPNIRILSTEYKNNKIPVLCQCLLDNHIWYARPDHLMVGKGCPLCGGSMKKTYEEFIKELNQLPFAKDIEIIGEYVNTKTPIAVKCKKDDHIWYPTPYTLLMSKGCPKCQGLAQKTTEEFIEEMKIINPFIEIIGEYVNNKTPIECYCLKDGCTWYAKPNDLIYNHGCPMCNASRGENRIAAFLVNNNLEYTPQYRYIDCRDILPLPFDFYVNGVLVEYQGEYHYEPIYYANYSEEEAIQKYETVKLHDAIKAQYCLDNNIKLIIIPYWDFNNIDSILTKELLN